MEETSMLASRSICTSTCEVSSDPPSEIINPFLIITNLLQTSISTTNYTDDLPLCYFETLGEGLSFTVKKSPDNISAYKASRLTFTSTPTPHDSHLIRSLLMELHILAHPPLKHRNIIRLLGVSWTPNPHTDCGLSPFLNVEFAPHGTLADFLASGAILPHKLKFTLCADIGNGLRALHAAGVVHGDVKAENVLVFDDPENRYVAKLCDFGCAVITDGDGDTLCRLPGGTIPWCAPEADGPVRRSMLHKTDVYSFGLLVWKVWMNGRDPFSAIDLPKGKEERWRTIRGIMASGILAVAAIVVRTIEIVGGDLTRGEVEALLDVFHLTLVREPEGRDLGMAVEVLVGMEDGQVEGERLPPQSIGKISRLDLTLNKITLNHWYLSQWSTTTQHLFLTALSDVASTTPRTSDLHLQSLECLFKCHLLGIGTEVDHARALQYLYDINELGNPKKFRFLSFLAPLHEALCAPPRVEKKLVPFQCMWAAAATGSVVARRWMEAKGISIESEPFALVGSVRGLLAQLYGIDQSTLLVAQRKWFAGMGSDMTVGGGNTLLHSYVLFGDFDSVKKLVEGGGEVNDINNKGMTPLLIACQRGHYNIAKYLLERGADASQKSITSEAPLHWIFTFQTSQISEVVTKICQHGGAETVNDIAGPYTPGDLPETYTWDLIIRGTPLERAVGRNSPYAVRAILELLSTLTHQPANWSTYLERSITLAVSLHLAEILSWLLSKIYDEDETCTEKSVLGQRWRDPNGHPLLLWALTAKFKLERLLIHGKHHTEAMKATFAVLRDYGAISTTLDINGISHGTLHKAIPLAPHNVLQYLLDETACVADVNTPDPRTGYTTIHEAIRYGKKTAFSALVAHGATLNLREKYHEKDTLRPRGENYLAVCASYRTRDAFFAKEVVKAGVPVDLPDVDGMTPLALAVFRRAWDVAYTLLDCGANVNTLDEGGYTLLGRMFSNTFLVRSEDLVKSVKFLLDLKSPYEPPSFIVHPANNLTILHRASACRTPAAQLLSLMTLLLTHYPTPTHLETRSATTATALVYAIESQNLPAIQALISSGASLSVLGPNGTTTLQLARTFIPTTSWDAPFSHTPKNRSLESKTRRALEIVALIESAHEWPDDHGVRSTILSLYRELQPHLTTLASISHEESHRLGMQEIVYDIAARHTATITLEEQALFHRQINGILQPWFFAEILLYLFPLGSSKTPPNSALQAIQDSKPWLKLLNKQQLLDFQQSAMFEFVLDELAQMAWRDDPRLVEHPAGILLVTTRSGAGTPGMAPNIRYPLPLLELYTKMLSPGGCLAAAPEEVLGELLEYKRVLEERDVARRAGQQWPEYGEGFRKFHFGVLQMEELGWGRVEMEYAFSTSCNCHRGAVGTVTMTQVERIVEASRRIEEGEGEAVDGEV